MSETITPGRIVALAEAVKATINEGSIPNCPAAERVLKSLYNEAKTDAFQVDVVFGPSRSYTRLARAAWSDRPSIDIAIYKKIGPTDVTKSAANAEGDVAIGLAESIADTFRPVHRLGSFRLLSILFLPQINEDWIDLYGVIGAMLSLPFSDP